jgi:hypothetical protein
VLPPLLTCLEKLIVMAKQPTRGMTTSDEVIKDSSARTIIAQIP